ncbi:GGDEF domain protein [Cellvibrio japonicus Ueda107]|uniref:diguanylate cyclase n=2 Tax=Cellvibrio japonicus TaxID=155077 RepID=B3PKT4_CELJU|nr:GGDEF domain protein [Cellvibrio japonicus Ueda107]
MRSHITATKTCYVCDDILMTDINPMLKLHQWKLLGLALLFQLCLLISLSLSEPKAWADIDWLDVASEGGFALLMLVWLLLILQSRPQGRVTQWLSLSLGLIVLAQCQDVLDEFMVFPDSPRWDHWVESGCMLLGMLLLTVGIYFWHQEQWVINRQLRKREGFFREHRNLDNTTLLSRADYFRQQLTLELERHRQQQAPLAVMLVDVDAFALFNRQQGHREGDRYLLALGELLLLNLRDTDLLCRYAGDRFAIILPFTEQFGARALGHELQAAVAHFAFKTRAGHTHINHISLGIAYAQWGEDAIVPTTAADSPAEILIKRAHQQLLLNKNRAAPRHVAA